MADELRPLPAPSDLRKLLRYEPETGKLYWLARQSKSWNTRYAGTEALTAKSGAGYLTGLVQRRHVKAHRVAWALHYGVWPTEIDHINGDKADNRIANLRDVNRRMNSRNRGIRSDNSTGVLGVSIFGGKFRVRIHVDGKEVQIGTFATLDEAAAARREASARHGYHSNHGRAS